MVKQADDQELYNEHLRYECEMLVTTDQVIGRVFPLYPVNNALIEAFCFHARVLIEFFNEKYVGTSPFVDRDYRAWASGKPSKILVTKLNTHVAHLTRNRTTNPELKINDADRSELLRCIVAQVFNFASHLKPEFERSVLYDAIALKLA